MGTLTYTEKFKAIFDLANDLCTEEEYEHLEKVVGEMVAAGDKGILLTKETKAVLDRAYARLLLRVK